MAFVFKPKGRRKWYARFRHPETGRLITRAGYVDRAATVQLAARLERSAARQLEGIEPSEHSRAPVLAHVAAFVDHLRAKGDGDKHVGMREQHVKAVVLGLGWTSLAQVRAGAVEKLLAEWRGGETKRGRRGFGGRTSNHYLTSLKHWSRWLVRTGRLSADPFVHLTPVNADLRHPRRTLTAAELGRLIATARASSVVAQGLTGRQRAALYLAAARTGLRARELASLTPDSFDLRSTPPTWTVAAEAEKARRGARLPLAADLAAELRTYIAGLPAGAALWPGPWAAHGGGAKLIRVDLAAAKIPYRTAAGVADFHALRVTFITDLARAGVPLQAAMRLARHSDPKLTAAIYSKLTREDLADELAKLPAV